MIPTDVQAKEGLSKYLTSLNSNLNTSIKGTIKLTWLACISWITQLNKNSGSVFMEYELLKRKVTKKVEINDKEHAPIRAKMAMEKIVLEDGRDAEVQIVITTNPSEFLLLNIQDEEQTCYRF